MAFQWLGWAPPTPLPRYGEALAGAAGNIAGAIIRKKDIERKKQETEEERKWRAEEARKERAWRTGERTGAETAEATLATTLAGMKAEAAREAENRKQRDMLLEALERARLDETMEPQAISAFLSALEQEEPDFAGLQRDYIEWLRPAPEKPAAKGPEQVKAEFYASIMRIPEEERTPTQRLIAAELEREREKPEKAQTSAARLAELEAKETLTPTEEHERRILRLALPTPSKLSPEEQLAAERRAKLGKPTTFDVQEREREKTEEARELEEKRRFELRKELLTSERAARIRSLVALMRPGIYETIDPTSKEAAKAELDALFQEDPELVKQLIQEAGEAKIKVIRLADGVEGMISEKYFDPKKYKRVDDEG